MASLGADIRTFLVNSSAVQSAMSTSTGYTKNVGVIEQNTIRENAPSPRIWYQLNRENEDLDLSNVGGLVESIWDIEVHTEGDATRFNIAQAIKKRMHGYIGTIGTTSAPRTAHSIKVEDHDDDYIPRGVGSTGGLYVAAMRATIWHDST